jgi:hypothetical protein
MNAHRGVGVEKAPRIIPIGADAADLGRQVQHRLRFRIPVQPLNIGFTSQVILPSPRHEDIGIPPAPELLDDKAPQESRAPGYHDGIGFRYRHLIYAVIYATGRFLSCSAMIRSRRARAQSESVIIFARPAKSTRGFHPSTVFALVGSPSNRSTSAGRK